MMMKWSHRALLGREPLQSIAADVLRVVVADHLLPRHRVGGELHSVVAHVTDGRATRDRACRRCCRHRDRWWQGPGHWYGRYYADWDAAQPGAWVRGELVPGGFYGGNWGGSTLSWHANWFSKHGAKMPKGVHYIAPGRSMTRLTEKLNPSDTGVMRLQFRVD